MKTWVIIALSGLSVSAWGQQVIVNPDGTHSIRTGSVIVNPNGTHSVRTGSVIVNPNGTHSTIHSAGRSAIIVGPDGSHTLVQDSSAVDAYRARSSSLEPRRGKKNDRR